MYHAPLGFAWMTDKFYFWGLDIILLLSLTFSQDFLLRFFSKTCPFKFAFLFEQSGTCVMGKSTGNILVVIISGSQDVQGVLTTITSIR